ncbi:MAG: hypothetical protein ABSA79_09090 [Candidatus Bathyarchaeia archaeon]|jgi:hypothetical protein
MDLLRTLADLEDNPKLHLARLLILLKEFDTKKGGPGIDGKTKLVKLDFLLRYPVYLERALKEKKLPESTIAIMEYERSSIESTMIRYRFGPWDPRYDTFINLLIGMGLCELSKNGRMVYIGLTQKGFEAALRLSKAEEFENIVNRSRILRRYFNQGGTSLMNFIYDTFPEIVSLKTGETIKYEY